MVRCPKLGTLQILLPHITFPQAIPRKYQSGVHPIGLSSSVPKYPSVPSDAYLPFWPPNVLINHPSAF